jgi:hypothetical protein
MLGFRPLGSQPLATATIFSGSGINVYNIPSGFIYHTGNGIPTQNFNIPGHYQYFALTGASVITPTGPRRVSWIGAEILHSGRGDLRISSISLEVLHTGRGFLRVSSMEVEVLHNAHADLHISQICVEVLRSIRAQDDAEVTHVY